MIRIDLRKFKIGTLLSVGMVLIVGLMICATAYSNYLTTNAQRTISKSTTRVFDVLTIQRDTGELFSAMEDMVVYHDQQKLKEAKDKIDGLHKRAEKTIREAGQNKIFDEAELAKAEGVLSTAQEATEHVIKSKIGTIRASEDDESSDSDQFYQIYIDSDQQLTQIRNIGFEMESIFHEMTIRSDEEHRSAMELVAKAQYITWIVIGTSIVLAVSLAFFLIKSVKQIFDLKNEFVNIIAHDLRNPVTAIKGYIELIATYKDKSKSKLDESLKAVNISVHKLNLQINNLLEVGRTEAGRIKLSLETMQPFEVVDESVLRAQAFAEISGVKINYEKAKNENVYISADRSKLSDILDNLISNAIKYNRKNGIVTVSTDETKEMLSISVTDTGQGIPEDQKEKIFKKYSRLDTDKGKKVKGTGLGLYTVKLAMDQMQGNVSFETEEGKGTTFTVSFKKVSKDKAKPQSSS
jgi:signal transduction histidine kinase